MRRYGAFLWKAGIYHTRSLVDILDLFLWPLLMLIPFGLFGKYTGQLEVIPILIIGLLGWVTVSAVQRMLVVQFLIEVWQHTVKRNRVLPISDLQYITGNWLVGVLRGLLTFFLITGAAYFMFGFNLLVGDFRIILLALLGMFISALVIGAFVISVIKIFGHRADAVAWFITDILVMFAGVYYSVSIFPANLRIISNALPLTYIFETLRQGIINGASLAQVWPAFQTMFILLAAYLVAVSAFFVYAERRAQKTGFYQKYD